MWPPISTPGGTHLAMAFRASGRVQSIQSQRIFCGNSFPTSFLVYFGGYMHRLVS